VNGEQYLILAYSAGLGLLLSYAIGLLFAARAARNAERRAVVVPATTTPGGVL
jgi:hypothetical protein